MAEPFQILLVDDDPKDIELIEIQFNHLDIVLEIHSVNNKEDFLEFLDTRELPDLIICDYHLPKYTGEKALKKVREKHSFLPFILVTGYLDEEEAVELMRKGASDIITKEKLDRLGPAVQRELINFRERKETQREIEIAHNRFRSLVEQGGDVVVVFDDEGIPEYISPSIEKVFGYPIEEAMSINLDEVTHPDDFHHVQEALRRAMKSPGENIPVPPVRMKHKDGTWRWFKTSLTDLRHQPSVSGIVDNIRDIHEQVLNARNNKLMLNNTEDSFVYINRELVIQSFNDRFASNYKDAFGIEVKHGQSILEYAQPERRKIVKDIYDRVLQGETVEGELPHETQEGKTRHFQIKYKPAKDENENIIGSFISIIEITEEKNAKLELEKNEARYRALVENGSDVLFILEPDGNPKYISPSIKNVLGYTAEEAMQIDMMENAHPDDVEMISDEIKKCLDQPGVPLKVSPARLKDKDGNWHWFEGTITNMLHDPAIEGIVDNFHEITERVEAEQKTVEAKNQYQSLVQSINGIFWEAEPGTFKVTYMSPQSRELLGYDPDEWMRTEGFWMNRIHPDDRETVYRKSQLETNTGNNHELEYRFKKADGEYIWIRDIVSVITKDGKAEIIRGIMTDITQEKELEFKLKQAYQLAKIGNWELDLVNEELYWSKYIKELHEVDGDYKPNLDTAINFYKEGRSRDTISKAVENSVEKAESFDVELQIETAKGNERWVRVVGRPEFVDDTCVRVYGSTQDITDRKRAQIEQQKAEEKYRNVVEHSTNMFYQHDTDGVLTYVSPQSKQFLGYPPEEARKHWTEFITDHPLNKKGEEITQRAMDTGVIQEPYELQLRTADDRVIWVEVNEVPLVKDSNVEGIVGSLTDITERKQFEEKLKESLERYDYASKATRDAIYDWDIQKDHLHWGEGFKTLFGHEGKNDESPLEKFRELVHPDDAKEGRAKLESVLQDPTVNHWEYEYRFRRVDGSYAYVIENGYIIRGEDGKATRMIGAIRDITEKTELERLLNEAQKIARIGGWEVDLVSEQVYWSPITKEIHEVDADFEPALEAAINFYKEGESRDIIRNVVQEAIENGAPFDVELQIVTAKGNERWIRAKAEPEIVDDKCVRLYGSFHDIHDRKETQAKMIEALEERRRILERITEAFFAVDNNWTVTYWNSQAEEILGVSKDQILGLNLWDEFSEAIELKFFSEYHRAFEEQVSVHFEEYFPPLECWFEVYGYPSKEGLSVFFHDITDKKAWEEELKQANEKLKTAQDIANLGYFEFNLQSEEVYWSEQSYKIWEFDRKENISIEKILNHMPPEDREHFLEQHEKMLETGKPLNLVHRILVPDGSVKWVRILGNLKKSSDGAPVSVKGTAQDITKIKRSEEKIRRSNERFEKVTEATNDAIWDFDVAEDELFWGKGFDTLFGYDLENTDPSFSLLLSLMHPEDRQRVSKKIEAYMAPDGKSDWFEEYRFKRADGTYAYVMDRAIFIRNEAGEVIRVVGAMTDLTRQKEYEESLKTLNKELEEQAEELAESNAELEQFAYVASHDLQEPLRMVSSFLTQLEKKYSDQLDEKALQYIDFAVDGANRMRQIILDLLNYSRLNRDQEKREATDLNDLVEEVLTLSRLRIKKTGAKITIDSLPTLEVNPGAIKQVFQNLLNNSLKYQQPGSVPNIKIETEKLEDYWQFSIRDNGIGIQEEFLDTIFQLFQRLHTRDQYSGTGIGLAIAKKIIERHGGEIWVESEEGHGSTFHFTLEK